MSVLFKKYKLEKSEKFDDFLQELGKSRLWHIISCELFKI